MRSGILPQIPPQIRQLDREVRKVPDGFGMQGRLYGDGGFADGDDDGDAVLHPAAGDGTDRAGDCRMKPVSIIIPVYGRDDALATVPFLLRQPYADAIRIIVVDNGNEAGRSSRLKALSSAAVEVISFPENRGGSAAYIAGMERGRCKFPECRYVWLLDDGTRLVAADARL